MGEWQNPPKQRRGQKMAEVPRIEPTDIAAALNLAATDEDFELGDLAADVLKELGRRIKDPVLRQELPGTGLIQLAKELAKLQPKETDDDAAGTSVLQLVQESSLPDERKKELLLSERERLQEELELVNLELEEY